MSNKSSVKKTVIKLLKKRTLLTLLATTIFALVFIIFALNTSAATIGFANDSFFSLFTSKNILATQTPICDSAIHPVYLDIAAEGGQGSFEVLIESGCPWSAESNASWITTNSSGTTGGMVNFTVASTPDQGRSGTITIHTPVDTQTFTVLQKDKDCSFSLSPGFNRSPSTGGNSSFQVFPSRPQCEWTASSNNPWISLTGATGGVGNGTIDYNVAPNSGSFIRIGTIRVEDTLFTIQQDPLLPPPPCSPTSVFFNVSSANFGVVGGNGEFSVSTQTTGCRFTVTSNASWITITSGINDSPVKYTVAPNTGPARTGTISVSGRLFTVTQSESCNFVITPSSINIPAAGLTGSFAVTTGAECTWTARSEDIDVNILSGSGTGNGTVNYRVIRNTGEERTLRISVNGVVFTITQASGVCVTSIDPSSATFSSGFANSSFAVIAPSGCEWQSEDNASWISTFSTGTGNGVVNFSVLENYTDSLRTGTVKVGGRTFTITQTAWQGITCTYSITPLSQNISASGGNGSFQITTPTFCPWIARSNASWITTSSSGAGNGTINFIVAPNSGVARSGTIRVGGKLFTITQAAPTNCNYTINPTSANIAASGGNSSFSITVPSGCS
ncbi:MAG TPA: BACON domain-containing carbohydrate-binding protein, partial [Pyrinomonadaceae bacterium]|nr:BACON domain-containing carbohydrate-binding protein [Pyrinomonadaceae bacterium]